MTSRRLRQVPTLPGELLSTLATIVQIRVDRLFGKGLAQPVPVIVAMGTE